MHVVEKQLYLKYPTLHRTMVLESPGLYLNVLKITLMPWPDPMAMSTYLSQLTLHTHPVDNYTKCSIQCNSSSACKSTSVTFSVRRQKNVSGGLTLPPAINGRVKKHVNDTLSYGLSNSATFARPIFWLNFIKDSTFATTAFWGTNIMAQITRETRLLRTSF